MSIFKSKHIEFNFFHYILLYRVKQNVSTFKVKFWKIITAKVEKEVKNQLKTQSTNLEMPVKLVLLFLTIALGLLSSIRADSDNTLDNWSNLEHDLLNSFSVNHDGKRHRVVKKELKPANYRWVESTNDWELV
ncbi:unnamed protein product [Ceratitis capitata]|uniref:(Mediterranean fruit fly) hypothetical protein n=1 Tax=Ceratitis capitata TaxID=7213 RepID=A0A811UZC4_CERCA|nr:unnamed protein product [Ceratitis capitata]